MGKGEAIPWHQGLGWQIERFNTKFIFNRHILVTIMSVYVHYLQKIMSHNVDINYHPRPLMSRMTPPGYCRSKSCINEMTVVCSRRRILILTESASHKPFDEMRIWTSGGLVSTFECSSLLLVLGKYLLKFPYEPGLHIESKIDFWLVWDRYILGIESNTRLV